MNPISAGNNCAAANRFLDLIVHAFQELFVASGPISVAGSIGSPFSTRDPIHELGQKTPRKFRLAMKIGFDAMHDWPVLMVRALTAVLRAL